MAELTRRELLAAILGAPLLAACEEASPEPRRDLPRDLDARVRLVLLLGPWLPEQHATAVVFARNFVNRRAPDAGALDVEALVARLERALREGPIVLDALSSGERAFLRAFVETLYDQRAVAHAALGLPVPGWESG